MLSLCLLTLLTANDAPLIVRADADPSKVEVIARLDAKLLGVIADGKLSQEQGERFLRFALANRESNRPGAAMFGAYERRGAELIFVPRHPLQAASLYRASFEVDGKTIAVDYLVPAKKGSTAALVEKVYPSADVLPANQLKFYIHFSRPMREGKEVFDRIKLLDAGGKTIAEPWRRTELWSADNRRLTLWIHPGRIKQGVNLRDEEGPVLASSRRYTLLIGAELLDADGQPLSKEHCKTFRTGPEKQNRPLVEDWKLDVPAAGTQAELTVRFPDPLDRALVERMLRIVDAAGREVKGTITVGPEERSWSFRPALPWQSQDYVIHVDGELEDLAGNTPIKSFDVDLTKPLPKPGKLMLAFRPK